MKETPPKTVVETIRAHQAKKMSKIEKAKIDKIKSDKFTDSIEMVKTEYSSPDNKLKKSTNSEKCSDFSTSNGLSKDTDDALKKSVNSWEEYDIINKEDITEP